jgi:hypothetical protein
MLVSALQRLDTDISNLLKPVDCYMNELNSLLEHENNNSTSSSTSSSSSSSSLSDSMLLGELSTATFMKNFLCKNNQPAQAINATA